VSILRDLFGPGTWGAGGNLAAAPILAVISGVATWLLRHHIGRVLAAWWALHHRQHAIAQHKEAAAELVALVEAVRSEVEELRVLVEAQGRTAPQ
jgi:hypothetical protein